MLPFIRAEDYVIIKPARAEEVKVGDIVVYSNNGLQDIICHRLLKKLDSALITKGDSFLHGYERIPHQLLLGKVITIMNGKVKINLETYFNRSLASIIAWISYNLPSLLVFLCYLIEALRAPHLVPIKTIHKIRSHRIL